MERDNIIRKKNGCKLFRYCEVKQRIGISESSEQTKSNFILIIFPALP